MKKKMSLAVLLFVTISSIAQHEPILGKWSETKYTFVDTLDEGRDLILKDYTAYRSGKKKLAPQFIAVQQGYTDKNEKSVMTITKVNDEFWVIGEENLKYKITYSAGEKKYYITMQGTRFEVKYDSESKNLYFINPELNTNFYEFKRKA